MKIKVAIADDHPLVINGLRHILGNCADMEITGTYNDGAELLAGMVQQQPDVLLLDIQMPGKTGDELAAIISVQYPQVQMVALTNLDNIYYIKNMLRTGVNGYVLKTTREETLLAAIRSVHSGTRFLEPVLMEKLIADALEADNGPVVPVLSRREKEVLACIATDLSSQQIADKLFISKRTVDNHRTSLLMKLEVKNTAALVKKAMQLGLI